MQREMYGDRPTPAEARQSRRRQVHRRRFAFVVSLLALMIVVTASASHSCESEAVAAVVPAGSAGAGFELRARLASATYIAQLKSTASESGAPPVAQLTLDYDVETNTLFYTLEVTAELADPSVAAICQGSPETTGTTVITLFPGPTLTGQFTGRLAEGTVVDQDLVGPLTDGTVADLIGLIEDGGAYATIGTVAIPVDAATGQIRTVPAAVPGAPVDTPAP
jgi:hypothetical protein